MVRKTKAEKIKNNYNTGLTFLFGTMKGADVRFDSIDKIYLANVDDSSIGGTKTKKLIGTIMKLVADVIVEDKKKGGKKVLGFEMKNIEISFDYSSYEKSLSKKTLKGKNIKSQSDKTKGDKKIVND